MAFRDNTNYGKTYWLSINSDGNVYERSQEPKEGFVEHINQINGQSAGYWKEYYNGIVGYLNFIGLKTITSNKPGSKPVEYFIMTFKDYDLNENYCLMFPVSTQSGRLHRYVKSFVKYFQNIDYSKPLVLNAFKRGQGEEYAPSELIIAYPGESGEKDVMVERYYKAGVNGWPNPVKTTGFDGIEKTSYIEQDNFAYGRLKEYINVFNQNIKDIRNKIMAEHGISQPQSAPVNNGSQNVQPQAPQDFRQPAATTQQQAVQEAPVFGGQQAATAQAPKANGTTGFNSGFQANQQTNAQQAPTFPPVEEVDDLPF